MALLPGKQIATGADGVSTVNLTDNALSSDVVGRAKLQDGFFDASTAGAKIVDGAVPISKLAEAVIQADGGQAFTANQSMGGFLLTNLATPIGPGDATTKAYADALISGLDPKESVRVATDAALPANTRTGNVLTASANGSINDTGIDGDTALVINERVLVKNEPTGANNGLYTITDLGSVGTPWILTRSTDADTSAEVTAGLYVFVEGGTVNADGGFVLTTNNPITLNTTALTFVQFSGAGQVVAGAGLTKTNNTLDVGAGNGIQVNADSVEAIYGAVGTLSTVNAGDAASAGVNNSASRSDHQHAVATTTAVGLGSANAEGSSTSLARADHVHVRDTARQESVTTQSIINADVVLTDTLNATPISNAGVSLFLNGVFQRQGATFDYTVSGTAITWLASSGTAVNMSASDELIAIYWSAS